MNLKQASVMRIRLFLSLAMQTTSEHIDIDIYIEKRGKSRRTNVMILDVGICHITLNSIMRA